MSDHIETTFQPSKLPIDVASLEPAKLSLRHADLASATYLLEQVLKADQTYLDSLDSALAAEAQSMRTGANFAPPEGYSFQVQLPEGAAVIVPGSKKSKWGDEPLDRFHWIDSTSAFSNVIVHGNRLHAGVQIPSRNSKQPLARFDIEGLRTQFGVVQIGLGASALKKIEIVPTPSKDDLAVNAKRIGTLLGFKFTL